MNGCLVKCEVGDGTCECCKDAAVVGGGCGSIRSGGCGGGCVYVGCCVSGCVGGCVCNSTGDDDICLGAGGILE